MCGRYAMNKTTDELITEFVAQGGRPEEWAPSFNVAPTNQAPIVRMHVVDEQPAREVEIAGWGLKPSWAKPDRPAPINARLESVATNGMFRAAFLTHRCLVPMRGYFEWQQQADGKQPYFLHSDAEVLAAAGLYAARKVDDDWAITFTVITREARDASGEVHDRMPVFLTDDTWSDWLNPDKITDPGGALDMLERSSTAIAHSITSYPVSRRVNNVRTADRTDPTLLEPITA